MRQIAEIPVEQILVLNPRERDPSKFNENVDSIARVGLKRPIVVNTRFLPENGQYELVCGQGRLEAVRRLGWIVIPALTVDVDRPTALIMSIAENAARHSPPPLWFANVVKGLHDGGMKLAEIADVIGRSKESVSQYLHLITHGEESLIQAVEQGRISVSLATEIASAPDKEHQVLLLKAYESGDISGSDLKAARHVIEMRQKFGKQAIRSTASAQHPRPAMSVEDLRKEIKRTMVKQEEFIKKSQRAENRLLILSEDFSRLRRDPVWRDLLQGQELTDFPKLKGDGFAGFFEFTDIEG